MSESYKLQPDGRRPIVFSGEEVASGSNKDHQCSGWHEVSVYTTDGGRWIVSIQLITQWQGEVSRHEVQVVGTPEEVAEVLEGYIPCPEGIGYPAGPFYEQKQGALVAQLRVRWEQLVSEILEDIPGCEERID